jgi:hypothetical protein
MSVIRFTQEDARWIMLPPLTAGYTGVVAISCEEARECEGIKCGERPEAVLSAEDLARWHDCHAERPLLRPHWHLTVRGVDPETRELIFAVFME